VDGTGLVILRPLQAVGVSADGKLQRVESVPLVPTTQSVPVPVMTGRIAPGRYIALAALAGGTAAAILLLTRNSNHQVVSPASP
jgi:hypothetical protein